MLNEFNIQENTGRTLTEIFRDQLLTDVGNITCLIGERLFSQTAEYVLFGDRPQAYMDILIEELEVLGIKVDYHSVNPAKVYLSWDIKSVMNSHRVGYEEIDSPV